MYGNSNKLNFDADSSITGVGIGFLSFLSFMILSQVLDQSSHEIAVKHFFPLSFVFIFCHFQSFITTSKSNANTTKSSQDTLSLQSIQILLSSLAISMLLVGEIGLSTQMYHQYQTIMDQQNLSWSQQFYQRHVVKSRGRKEMQ